MTIPSLPFSISLTEVLPGDFNSSASVDAGDYVTWRNGSGVLAPLMTSYDAFRSNFGNTTAMASSAAIPEPAASILLFLAALFIPTRRLR